MLRQRSSYKRVKIRYSGSVDIFDTDKSNGSQPQNINQNNVIKHIYKPYKNESVKQIRNNSIDKIDKKIKSKKPSKIRQYKISFSYACTSDSDDDINSFDPKIISLQRLDKVTTNSDRDFVASKLKPVMNRIVKKLIQDYRKNKHKEKSYSQNTTTYPSKSTTNTKATLVNTLSDKNSNSFSSIDSIKPLNNIFDRNYNQKKDKGYRNNKIKSYIIDDDIISEGHAQGSINPNNSHKYISYGEVKEIFLLKRLKSAHHFISNIDDLVKTTFFVETEIYKYFIDTSYRIINFNSLISIKWLLNDDIIENIVDKAVSINIFSYLTRDSEDFNQNMSNVNYKFYRTASIESFDKIKEEIVSENISNIFNKTDITPPRQNSFVSDDPVAEDRYQIFVNEIKASCKKITGTIFDECTICHDDPIACLQASGRYTVIEKYAQVLEKLYGDTIERIDNGNIDIQDFTKKLYAFFEDYEQHPSEEDLFDILIKSKDEPIPETKFKPTNIKKLNSSDLTSKHSTESETSQKINMRRLTSIPTDNLLYSPQQADVHSNQSVEMYKTLSNDKIENLYKDPITVKDHDSLKRFSLKLGDSSHSDEVISDKDKESFKKSLLNKVLSSASDFEPVQVDPSIYNITGIESTESIRVVPLTEKISKNVLKDENRSSQVVKKITTRTSLVYVNDKNSETDVDIGESLTQYLNEALSKIPKTDESEINVIETTDPLSTDKPNITTPVLRYSTRYNSKTNETVDELNKATDLVFNELSDVIISDFFEDSIDSLIDEFQKHLQNKKILQNPLGNISPIDVAYEYDNNDVLDNPMNNQTVINELTPISVAKSNIENEPNVYKNRKMSYNSTNTKNPPDKRPSKSSILDDPKPTSIHENNDIFVEVDDDGKPNNINRLSAFEKRESKTKTKPRNPSLNSSINKMESLSTNDTTFDVPEKIDSQSIEKEQVLGILVSEDKTLPLEVQEARSRKSSDKSIKSVTSSNVPNVRKSLFKNRESMKKLTPTDNNRQSVVSQQPQPRQPPPPNNDLNIDKLLNLLKNICDERAKNGYINEEKFNDICGLIGVLIPSTPRSRSPSLLNRKSIQVPSLVNKESQTKDNESRKPSMHSITPNNTPSRKPSLLSNEVPSRKPSLRNDNDKYSQHEPVSKTVSRPSSIISKINEANQSEDLNQKQPSKQSDIDDNIIRSNQLQDMIDKLCKQLMNERRNSKDVMIPKEMLDSLKDICRERAETGCVNELKFNEICGLLNETKDALRNLNYHATPNYLNFPCNNLYPNNKFQDPNFINNLISCITSKVVECLDLTLDNQPEMDNRLNYNYQQQQYSPAYSSHSISKTQSWDNIKQPRDDINKSIRIPEKANKNKSMENLRTSRYKPKNIDNIDNLTNKILNNQLGGDCKRSSSAIELNYKHKAPSDSLTRHTVASIQNISVTPSVHHQIHHGQRNVLGEIQQKVKRVALNNRIRRRYNQKNTLNSNYNALINEYKKNQMNIKNKKNDIF